MSINVLVEITGTLYMSLPRKICYGADIIKEITKTCEEEFSELELIKIEIKACEED